MNPWLEKNTRDASALLADFFKKSGLGGNLFMPILQARLVSHRRGKLESDTEGPTKWLVFLIKSSVLICFVDELLCQFHVEPQRRKREREILYIYIH